MTMMLTAGILLGAGFETTSSIVCATMYLLQRNPECLKKINEEVRGAFGSPEDITFSSVDNLPYLRACLSEALRWYPPIASGLPREVMKGGTSIAGEHVPEGVSPIFSQVCDLWILDSQLCRQSCRFTTGQAITPASTSASQTSIVQSAGSMTPSLRLITSTWSSPSWLARVTVSARSKCLAHATRGTIELLTVMSCSLAVAEMRSMLALLLYNFDFKMPEEYVGWAEKQKFYTLWDRPALEMYLTPAKAVV